MNHLAVGFGGVPFVSVEDLDGIAVVRVDRPPVNAIDLDLLEQILTATERLAVDPPDAVLFTGRPGSFCAGVDLKFVSDLDESSQHAMVDGINRLAALWYPFPRPVVMAVNGHAIGGGLVLALCGDYRVGSTEGKIGLTETRVGVPYPAGAITVVRAELPPASARAMALRAHLMAPTDALRLGALDELAEPDHVVERALEVTRELAALPAQTYERVKRQLRAPAIAKIERIVASDIDPHNTEWLEQAETAGAAASVIGKSPAS